MAWTYWRVTEADAGSGGNGPAVQMALPARSDPNVPLAPGGRSNLLVTLVNNHDFPVRITSVTAGPGPGAADDEHRDAGCTGSGRRADPGSVPGAVGRAEEHDRRVHHPERPDPGERRARACDGAVFTVPIQADGAGQGY